MVNILSKHVPNLIKRTTNMRKEAMMKKTKYTGFNSDDYRSDESGNFSQNDEMNILKKF